MGNSEPSSPGPESAWVGHSSDSSSLEKEWMKWRGTEREIPCLEWTRATPELSKWRQSSACEERSVVCICITLATIEECLTSMTWDIHAMKRERKTDIQSPPSIFAHFWTLICNQMVKHPLSGPMFDKRKQLVPRSWYSGCMKPVPSSQWCPHRVSTGVVPLLWIQENLSIY